MCKLLCFLDGFYRGEKYIDLKTVCDKAIEECKAVDLKIRNCIVVYNVAKEQNGSSSPVLKKSKGHEVSKAFFSLLFAYDHPPQSRSAVLFYLI